MIAFGILCWLMVGIFLYMPYGSASGFMTPFYWMMIWPIMIFFTIMERRKSIELWISGWQYPEVRKVLWRKINDFFKIRIE